MSIREVSRTLMRGFLRQPLQFQTMWSASHRSNSTASNHLPLIKKLRDQTGAPISDVKKALEQAGWNMGMHLHCGGRFDISYIDSIIVFDDLQTLQVRN